MEFATSQDIMEAGGLESLRTVIRWHRQGVIPPPTFVTNSAGKGRLSTWPKWVLPHCRAVRQLKEEGQTLPQIVGLFGQDWEAIAKKYRPIKLTSGRMDEKLGHFELRKAVGHALLSAVADLRTQLSAVELPAITEELTRQAISLHQAGYNPVLYLASPNVRIVPDFLIGELLTDRAVSASSCLVVALAPILKPFRKLLGRPKLPTIQPVRKVLVTDEQGAREVPFELTGDLGFKLQDP